MHIVCPPDSENVLWRNSEIDLEKAKREGTEVSRFFSRREAFLVRYARGLPT
jgi:hypothetical protein